MPLDAFADLQSYQQPQTGMALTGQQPATQPPVSPAEFQQRQQGWMNTFNEMLSNPVASTMLLQAGMSLLGGGTGGEALGDAVGAVGRGADLMQKQQQQDFANQLAKDRFGLDQQELDLRRQQMGMQQQLMQQRLARGAGGGGGGGAGPAGKVRSPQDLIAMGYPPAIANQMFLEMQTKTGEFATKDPREKQAELLQKRLTALQARRGAMFLDDPGAGELDQQIATLGAQYDELLSGMQSTPHGPKMPGYYQPEASSEDQRRRLAELNPKVWGDASRTQIAGPVAPEREAPAAPAAPAQPGAPARWGPQMDTPFGPIQQKNGAWDLDPNANPQVKDQQMKAILFAAKPGQAVHEGGRFMFNLTADMITALRKKYGIPNRGW